MGMKGGEMEPIGVLLEGVASEFKDMASTPLITSVSIVVAVLTLVLLNELVKREVSGDADQER
jgi:hypothetical protein